MGATDTAFAGSIPAIYERYMGPLLFEPYAEDMAARLKDISEGRVLETAAGTGIVTRALAKALPPQVEIVATDLNQAMLDLAAERLQAANVTWRQADAQRLPFEDTSFDAVACQFGVMFFPDKLAGYREALRVLKPGGRFLFSVWDTLDRNEVSRIVSDTVGSLFPDDPPRFYERVPFAYSDPDRIRGEVQQAGFENVEIEVVEKVIRASTSRDPAIGLCQGTPLRAEIEARASERLEEITDRVADALTARFGSSLVENRMSALSVTAWR
ncbi:methyltransferase domain-containing protein [Microvirga terrae]|uniref:Methyltransferase domain-containing protein n=1 Tax=Microvirga terrae TaxID=2740529 RepID=A0ABY5RLI6_9HYPH|nr:MULTISPECIES: methyltransferase domain-containing protein [Microvirga]MBQ0823146.1 methyltransferase domain-containing protein [Microvirga sp. HBU67558]UVF17843.1 methyltransferase domain-containing protein [Microvirga terrae]